MSNGGIFLTAIGCPNMGFESEIIKSVPSDIKFSFVDWISRNQAYTKLGIVSTEQQEIKEMAKISSQAHNSVICLIFKHQHCIYNHLWDIQKAVREVKSWNFFDKIETIRLPGNCEINMADIQTIPLIKCMDGRSNMPAIRFFQNTLGAEVRLFTYPGANSLLVEPSFKSNQILRHIKDSYSCFLPDTLGISGHHDCRGNPVDNETHLLHLGHAASTAKKWGEFKQIIPIFVNENWEAQPVLP